MSSGLNGEEGKGRGWDSGVDGTGVTDETGSLMGRGSSWTGRGSWMGRGSLISRENNRTGQK